MYKLPFSAFLFFLTAIIGCSNREPTNISPINNSGRLLYGDISIGNEHIPFAHLSNYAGRDQFDGGEQIHAKITDLWSNETFTLTNTIPPRPSGDPYVTLLIEVDQNLRLNSKWKTESRDLESIHFAQYSSYFNCMPIVVKNDGNRKDFVVRIRQDAYSYALRRYETESRGNLLHYGFFQREKRLVRNTILVSYNQGATLETTVATIPMAKFVENPNISAIFIHLSQEKHSAKIHFLTGTQHNPRVVAESIQNNLEILPSDFLEIGTSKVNKEVRRLNFRLPDVEEAL